MDRQRFTSADQYRNRKNDVFQALPPYYPGSEIRRNYGMEVLMLREYKNRFGDNLQTLARDLTQEDARRRELLLGRGVEKSLAGFLHDSMTAVNPDSEVGKAIVNISFPIVAWIEGWVGGENSFVDLDPTLPMYSQVKARQYQEWAETKQELEATMSEKERQEGGFFIPTTDEENTWWYDLTFVRFLKAVGSSTQVLAGQAIGCDLRQLLPNIVQEAKAGETKDPQIVKDTIHLAQGNDVDYTVFPAEVYDRVFDEFDGYGILRKNIGKYHPTKIRDLTGDEEEKYELGIALNEGDINLPPGCRLVSEKPRVAYLRGYIEGKKVLPYSALEFEVDILHEATNTTLPYKLFVQEFMPAAYSLETAQHNTRSGIMSGALHEMTAAAFICQKDKLYQPVGMDIGPDSLLNQAGMAVKIPDDNIAGMLSPNDAIGDVYGKILRGEYPFDDTAMAELISRQLRSGLFSWILVGNGKNTNYFTRWRLPIEPGMLDYYFSLSTRLNTGKISSSVMEHVENNIRQGWLLDFPEMIRFMEESGYARHFELGADNEEFAALQAIAKQVTYDRIFTTFAESLERIVERGEPIDHWFAQSLVYQNLTKVVAAIKSDPRLRRFAPHGKSNYEIMWDMVRMVVHREFESTDFWGKEMTIQQDEKDYFLSRLKSEVRRLGKPLFGYVVQNEDTFTYHMSHYPRVLHYNVPSTEECNQAMNIIASNMRVSHTLREDRYYGEPRFRVVMGMNEGYEGKKTYTIDEVNKLLGEGFQLKRASILVVKPGNQVYEEPAVVIEGNREDLNKVYRLADRFKQERFAVEVLHEGRAYMVETRHCQNSDTRYLVTQT